MENSSSSHSESIGTFTKKHLDDFAANYSLAPHHLELLSNISSISHKEMENICSCKIRLKVFRLIKKFGLPIGAFLEKDFKWEIVSLATGQTNYMEFIIRLDDTEEIKKELKPSEIYVLRTLSNSCRLSLNIGLKPTVSVTSKTNIHNSKTINKVYSTKYTGIVPVC